MKQIIVLGTALLALVMLSSCVHSAMYTSRIEAEYPPQGEFKSFEDGRIDLEATGDTSEGGIIETRVWRSDNGGHQRMALVGRSDLNLQTQIDQLEPVPIIALTANAMKHQVAEYIAAGFDGHLPKPVSIEALYNTLTGCLRRPAGGK